MPSNFSQSTVRMPRTVRHGKWRILHLMLWLCNRMSALNFIQSGENHHPAMFHAATVRPKRLEPGLPLSTGIWKS